MEANGVLQGTVYYNSYNSAIVNGGVVNGQQVGSVLSIAPGATDPQLATTAADCCNPGDLCINGRCSLTSPPPPPK